MRTPAYGGSVVLLTGGTTGVPKGAPRQLGVREAIPLIAGLHPRMVLAIGDLAKIAPIPRLGNPMVIAPPLHHAYGFGALLLAFLTGSTAVVHERFEAEQTLADIERHSVRIACLVPTMVKRIMELPADVRQNYHTETLQMVLCGAAPMPPWLAVAFMDEFGDVLFNGYGSTESGAGAVATPADLRAAPGTVGKPPTGFVDIRIVDEQGREVPAGTTGRIVNKNPTMFRGYSDGEQRAMVEKYMDTGDVGHLDTEGRLFIEGRSDDMIVSGGENVFPQEVETVLLAHPALADAGAVGVPDDDFGQRLAAAVVLQNGASVTADELKQHIKSTLANYKVPRDIVFVTELPAPPRESCAGNNFRRSSPNHRTRGPSHELHQRFPLLPHLRGSRHRRGSRRHRRGRGIAQGRRRELRHHRQMVPSRRNLAGEYVSRCGRGCSVAGVQLLVPAAVEVVAVLRAG